MGLAIIKRLRKKIFAKKNQQVTFNRILDFVPDISKGDIIIDCGANIGDVIKPISNIGCKIIAFEPNPYAFKVLYQKFKNCKNIKCISKAISTSNGKAKLYLHENSEKDNLFWSTGSSLLNNKVNVNKKNYVFVEKIDFSKYLLSIEKDIKVVKIDIEGEEISVLNQIIDYGLHNKIHNILVETHQKKIPSQNVELDKLKKRINKMNISNISLEWH